MKNKIHSYLPIEWASRKRPSDGRKGLPVKDAGTIYIVNFDEESKDFERLILKTSIKKLVMGLIDLHINPVANKVTDKDGILVIRKVQAALHKEICRLEKCIGEDK